MLIADEIVLLSEVPIRLPLLFLSLLLVLAASVQNVNAQKSSNIPKSEKCSVAGTVLRKGTDEPIRYAHVTFQSLADPENSLHSTSGVDGKFSLNDIAPGQYRISVSRNGYVSIAYGASQPFDSGVPLSLAPGQQMSDLLFRLAPAGLITGRVRDQNGEPLPSAQVTALLTSYVEGKRTLVPVSTVTTNDLGEYRLFNLPPGKYLVSASSGSGLSKMARATSSMMISGEEDEGLVTTFYPGTSDPGQAQALNIAAGSELRSTDISVLQSGIFHIRGHVAGLIAFSSKTGGMIMLKNSGSHVTTLNFEKNAAIDPTDGSFDIPGVSSGQYDLIAFEFSRSGTPRSAHKPIEVNGADVDGVEIAFEPITNISGHLTWDDKSAAPNVPLRVSLELEDQFMTQTPSAEVQPDGSFELKNVSADSYWVNVSGSAPDAYLKSARYGSANALNTFRTSTGAGPALELIAGAHGGHIQGVVTNSDPVPISGVWVALVPDEPNRKQKRLYQSVRSAANGKFEFRGVAPGSYLLFSWENVLENEWFDPDFLKQNQSKGTEVSVTEGESKSVDLTTIPAKNAEENN